MLKKVLGALLAVLLVAALAGCGLSFGDSEQGQTKEPKNVPVPDLPTTAAPAVSKPNILVVEADDMRSDELAFMPNVRKLIGDRGLTFENSFAPYPLCCPSRATFLSGKYAHNHHVLSHSDPYGFKSFDDRTTIATQLQAGGYQTGLIGKYLNGYGKQHIFGKLLTDISDKYVPPGWTQWMAGSDHGYPSGRLRGGTYSYYSMTQVVNGTITPHPGVYSTELTSDQAQDTIQKFGKAKKPWFLWWTPVAPHFGNPKEKDDPAPIRDAKNHKVRFPTPARPAWVKGRFDKVITKPLGLPDEGPVEADNSDKPKLLRKFPEPNTAERKAMTNLSRQRAEAIYALDREVGRTLTALKKSGQYDNTIVVFTSDNGYFLGEHRRPQGKILVHEPSLRVPFLIAGPGVPHGVRYDPITTVDLAATWSDFAGLGPMPQTDGHSLVPVITGGDQGWQVPVVTEGLMENRGYLGNYSQPNWDSALDVRGIRTPRWKYTKYSTGEVELYDMTKDPLEQNSLQNDPAYADVIKRMDKLWYEYRSCAQEACRKPLPQDLQMSPEQEKAITDNETAETRAYYDTPADQP